MGTSKEQSVVQPALLQSVRPVAVDGSGTLPGSGEGFQGPVVHRTPPLRAQPRGVTQKDFRDSSNHGVAERVCFYHSCKREREKPTTHLHINTPQIFLGSAGMPTSSPGVTQDTSMSMSDAHVASALPLREHKQRGASPW